MRIRRYEFIFHVSRHSTQPIWLSVLIRVPSKPDWYLCEYIQWMELVRFWWIEEHNINLMFQFQSDPMIWMKRKQRLNSFHIFFLVMVRGRNNMPCLLDLHDQMNSERHGTAKKKNCVHSKNRISLIRCITCRKHEWTMRTQTNKNKCWAKKVKKISRDPAVATTAFMYITMIHIWMFCHGFT